MNHCVAAMDRNDVEAATAYQQSAANSHGVFANLARLHLAKLREPAATRPRQGRRSRAASHTSRSAAEPVCVAT
jgi:hypothetical protein